jgi:hypothetical protein
MQLPPPNLDKAYFVPFRASTVETLDPVPAEIPRRAWRRLVKPS